MPLTKTKYLLKVLVISCGLITLRTLSTIVFGAILGNSFQGISFLCLSLAIQITKVGLKMICKVISFILLQ